ncbi:MAG: class I SAM-dependent methyltransferase [Gemmatimonadales bacterium]|nr:MAG: class I SAM-dependent methyltransferase [Gemmatimonadales bacterium]
MRWLDTGSRVLARARMKRTLRAVGAAHAPSIPTWTRPEELTTLYELASRLPHGSLAVEIGSYLGASTCYLAAGLSEVDGYLVCVDTWQNESMPEGPRDTWAEFRANTRSFGDRLSAIRKRGADLDSADVPGPVLLAFIDGDHAYESVRADADALLPFLAMDAVLCFHDFGIDDHVGVTRVVGELLATGDWVPLRTVRSLMCLRRTRSPGAMPRGGPPSEGG